LAEALLSSRPNPKPPCEERDPSSFFAGDEAEECDEDEDTLLPPPLNGAGLLPGVGGRAPVENGADPELELPPGAAGRDPPGNELLELLEGALPCGRAVEPGDDGALGGVEEPGRWKGCTPPPEGALPCGRAAGLDGGVLGERIGLGTLPPGVGGR